jgi:hypothetical protein
VKPLVVALVVAWSCGAHADVPAGVAQRLVRFVFAGCDYLTAHEPSASHPEAADKKLASHFGRILRSELDGTRMRYSLKTAAFDSWDVSYFARSIDLKFPPTVAITIGDLQRLLGPDDTPDVDYALSTTSTGPKIKVEDRVFDTHREDYCYVTVSAEADRSKGAERRVFSLHFVD